MGNNRSQVSPVRSVKILDTQTRTRYKNRQELTQLNVKLRQLRFERDHVLARLSYEQHEAKRDLHKLKHEKGEKKIINKFARYTRQTSTASTIESSLFDDSESDTAIADCRSLLLCDLNAWLERQKTNNFSVKMCQSIDMTKSPTILEDLRSKYASKRENDGRYRSPILNDRLTLKQQTELMKNSIRISVARAARDSRRAARHKVRIY